jgi:uncharacterized membrane protein HdeD (DUF308 family)
MFHLFFRHHDRPPPALGGGLLFNGLISILFGIAVLAAPELLAYLVAVLLIVFGASMLTAWWQIYKRR